MVATTRRPSSAFMVFKSLVPVHGLAVTPGKEWATVTPGEEWAAVRCASKNAYGCGALGQQLAEGLTLYVRRAGAAHPDLTSSLSIGLSDEAAGSLAADLGFPRLEAKAGIKIAHREAIVLLLTFHYHCINRRSYYLAYDSTDALLRVIPCLPSELVATYTLTAVPVRGGPTGLALALMARARLVCPEDDDSGRICVCAPAAQADPEPDGTGGAWQAKVHRFPRLRQAFSADVVFSLHGKVFWADLSQGVAYSDVRAAAAVDTVFISLPDEYQTRYPQPKGSGPAKMSRTIGCVEGAIKFVCIVRHDHPGNETVKVLTLDLDRRLWEEDEGLSSPWNDLWKQAASMDAELRDAEPRYPTLLPDGSLFLLLPNAPQGGQWHPMDGNYCVCGFDMRSRSLQLSGQVHNYHTLGPLILPSDFFTKCYPPPCRRKLPNILMQTFEKHPCDA